MSGLIPHVRWATDADDAALRQLCLRTPMHGPISYCLEREPEFFALTRLQGAEGGRVALIEEGFEVVAMAMMAPMKAWVGGAEERCAYVGDLKVDPAHRSKGLAGLLVRFIGRELLRLGIDRSFFLVLAGNPDMGLIDHTPGHFEVRTLRTIRNFLVPFGSSSLRQRSHAGAVIRRASADDIPSMIALWNRCHRRRDFAPVIGRDSFDRSLSADRTVEEFRLLHRDGVLVGFCSVWDASAIKQIRLLRLSPGLRLAKVAYNLVSTLRGGPRFPRLGERLRFLYVSSVCAEGPEDLEALLSDVHDAYREAGYLYFDLALDVADPLTAALSGFRSMKIDFEIREALTPGRVDRTVPARTHACAFFDVSLV